MEQGACHSVVEFFLGCRLREHGTRDSPAEKTNRQANAKRHVPCAKPNPQLSTTKTNSIMNNDNHHNDKTRISWTTPKLKTLCISRDTEQQGPGPQYPPDSAQQS